jgi:hypothetical protein
VVEVSYERLRSEQNLHPNYFLIIFLVSSSMHWKKLFYINESIEWDLPSRQWLALTSILLIAGAASVAVPLALSVTAGKIIFISIP